MDFKVIDLLQNVTSLIACQTAYLNNVIRYDVHLEDSNEKFQTQIGEEKSTTFKSVLGTFALINSSIFPLCASHASTALQRYRKDHVTQLLALINIHNALVNAKTNGHEKTQIYILHEPALDIIICTHADFEKLRTKLFQIGFIMYRSGQHVTVKIIPWHGSRAIRRTYETKQAELMALDITFR